MKKSASIKEGRPCVCVSCGEGSSRRRGPLRKLDRGGYIHDGCKDTGIAAAHGPRVRNEPREKALTGLGHLVKVAKR